MKIKYLIPVIAMLAFSSCNDEEKLVASDNLNIAQSFSPGSNEAPEVHKLFNDYGVWVRMDFKDYKEVSVTPLATDANCRGAIMIKDEDRASAIQFSETLMSNVSKEYSKKFFPLELFYVNTYGASWWIYSFQQLGRCRLVIQWPNKYNGTIPITDPINHYYQDSVLSANVWNYLGNMIAAHLEEPISEFMLAGKSYDNGEAYDIIYKQYEKDENEEKMEASFAELCKVGGFVTAAASKNFTSDFSSWVKLLVLESYDNIKKMHLDNSPNCRKKYDILIKYFNDYGWNIQAAGNKYRQKYDEYKASLPEPEPEPEE